MSNNKLRKLPASVINYKDERFLMHVFYWDKPHVIDRLKIDLSNGNIVLSSTDTVLGLMSVLSKEGLQKLNGIKGRDLAQSNLVVVESIQKASFFIDIPSGSIIEKLAQCWPAPLTIIGKARKEIDPGICSSAGTIGVRVPNHPGLLSLLKDFNGLFSTSANRHGEAIPTTISEIDPLIKGSVSYIVLDNPDTEKYQVVSSTIVDCTDGTIKIVRRGLFDIDSFLQK